MKIAIQGTMLIGLLFSLVVTNPSSAADKSWDAIPHRKCSEMITPSGEFTAKTEAMLTWLVGYIDGISAPSILDKRLKTISDAGSQQIGPLVLVYCRNKQDDTLVAATTGVAELIINTQSGRVLNLRVQQ